MEYEAGSFEGKPRKLLPTEGISRPNSEDFPLPVLKPAAENLPLASV